MPIRDTLQAAPSLVVPLEWSRQLAASLRAAEDLLREHAADQAYALDGAPSHRARLWHRNQHEGALEAAEDLAAWRERLSSRPLHRPGTDRLRRALAATETAATALSEALNELSPTVPATLARA